MESNLKSSRWVRVIGARVGVMVLAAAALFSGCYVRTRPPEYGRRGYDHDRHDRGGYHDHDHDHDRRY